MVSEFMLQQTQTGRVAEYWPRWMRRWPRPAALAAAPLEDALREWSGLGYNRRAKYLRDAAAVITARYGGAVPQTPAELDALPGVGPYTAGAIACFAYNYPAVFVETNIRSAVIHCFFNGSGAKVNDSELIPVLERALDRKNPRKWYYALMDYGAALKKLTVNPSRKSAVYAKQSRFEGSFRQKRGGVLKSLAFEGPASLMALAKRTGFAVSELRAVIASLEEEALIAGGAGIYRISR
jgi:A/G-specific adenine glycosylase